MNLISIHTIPELPMCYETTVVKINMCPLDFEDMVDYSSTRSTRNFEQCRTSNPFVTMSYDLKNEVLTLSSMNVPKELRNYYK